MVVWILSRVAVSEPGITIRLSVLIVSSARSSQNSTRARQMFVVLSVPGSLQSWTDTMTVLDSLPAEPLHGDVILALNDSEAEMEVMPVSYHEEIYIYSMVIMTENYASVVGFDGDKWVELTRTTLNSDEEFDPEGVIDEWMQETHPDLYDDLEFEVTSEDYELE
jgi:hypothetical protein